MFDFTFFIIWVIVLPDYSRSYYECCFLWVFVVSLVTFINYFCKVCFVVLALSC